jgi:hypothetical protein
MPLNTTTKLGREWLTAARLHAWRKGFALLSRQVFDLQISSCADKFKDF